MKPLLIALLSGIPISLIGCNSAVSVSDDLKTKQAFKIYTVGHYSMFECNGNLEGSMDISENRFRLTETVCDLELLGISTTPLGPKARLKNCLSDGGPLRDAEVVFEATDSGLKLHGYDETIREFKNCPEIK